MKNKRGVVRPASTRTVAYVRVSTEDQAREGVSLDMQEERVRAYCVANGLELVALVREEGVSGSVPLADRDGGRDLVAHLDAGAAHVVALKLDRLFRDAADALNQTREWDRAGVALHLLDMGGQSINTASAMGRMFLTMAAGFAELERNLIAERTRSALHHKAAKGEPVSRAPRGLRIAGKALEVDPASDGLTIYRRARDLRAEGETFRRIAEVLTAEGYRPERGRAFHPFTVSRMLDNPRLAVHAAA